MNSLLCVAIVLAVVVAVIAFSKWTGNTAGLGSTVEGRINSLIKEGARYSTMADQDSNALMAIIHSSYAHAYLTASKVMLGNQANSTNYSNVGELANSSKEKQENAIRHLNTQFEDILPDSDAVASTGWII